MNKAIPILKWLLAACLPVLAAGCTNAKLSRKEAAIQKIDQVKAERQLGLVDYEITKVIKAKDKSGFLKLGNRSLLLTCTAYLEAGLDLTDFNPMTDIKVDEDESNVTITLPSPVLLSMNMPLDEVKEEYFKKGLTATAFTMAEMNTILRLGEEQIRDSVPDLGILEEAKVNAQRFFETLLKHMGFSTVQVTFRKPEKD